MTSMQRGLRKPGYQWPSCRIGSVPPSDKARSKRSIGAAPMLRRTSECIAWLEKQFANLAAAILFVLMAIVGADVVMRYFFNRPLAWAYDIISLYLMPGLFYLTLSRAQNVGAHIGVDILQSQLSDPARHLCQVIIGIVSAAFFIALVAFGGIRAYEELIAGSTVVGEFAWKTWISIAFVPLGAGLIAVRLLLSAIANALALFGLQAPLPLPAMTDSSPKSTPRI
jgi:TRAP-type C4-dicarboxylate transport system permease small subunit